MPLRGWTCPAGSPTAGQRNDGYEHCVTKCAHPCMSAPLLIALTEAEWGNYHKGSYLSASSLASFGCARQTFLERNVEFYETVRRRWWSFRGTVIHGLIEHGGAAASKYGWLQELRMSVPLVYNDLPAPLFDKDGQWTGDFDGSRPLVIQVAGTTDGYNVLRRELHDYKTMGDKKLVDLLSGREGGELSRQFKDSWVWQLNIYAYLVSRTPIEAVRNKLEAAGITVPATEFLPKPERLKLQSLTMMDTALSGTTHMPMRSKDVYEIDDVPLLPEAQVEAFIRERALVWFRWLVLKVRPPVVPEDQSWLCKNCQFNGEIIKGEQECFPAAERTAMLEAQEPPTPLVQLDGYEEVA